MLIEPLPKGHYLYKDSRTARKIIRTKNSKEYTGEKLYVIEGLYGTEVGPLDFGQLKERGFNECISEEELNKRFRNGEFIPSEGSCK